MEFFSNSLMFHIISTIFVSLLLGNGVDGSQARAYFVFGDSLVDNGNNNYLNTFARADAPPYGIDMPSHNATGRFSNGLNIVDFIGEYFGLQPNHPYLDPDFKGEQLLAGANFASAGVGILDDTGIQFLRIIGIYEQLENFKEYQEKVKKIIGPANTTKLVNESLTLISLGGNDFVNNYFLLPFSLRYFQYSVPEYCTLLISEFQKILEKLYEMGPGKVIVMGAASLGCAPAEMAERSKEDECAAEVQNAGDLFNDMLTKMILELNKKIGKDVFVFSNIKGFSSRLITNPQAYGFENSKEACCGQGRYNGIGLCTMLSNLCTKRDKYVFWDHFHAIERANKLIVEQMYNSSTQYMNPMNLSTIKAMFSNDP